MQYRAIRNNPAHGPATENISPTQQADVSVCMSSLPLPSRKCDFLLTIQNYRIVKSIHKQSQQRQSMDRKSRSCSCWPSLLTGLKSEIAQEGRSRVSLCYTGPSNGQRIPFHTIPSRAQSFVGCVLGHIDSTSIGLQFLVHPMSDGVGRN